MLRSPALFLRLLLGILLPLLLVGVLTEEVLSGARSAAETPFMFSLHAGASETLNRIAILCSNLGGVAVIAPASALLLLYFWLRRRTVALFFAVAVGGSALLTVAMKLLFPRARPQLWPRLVAERDASFPSGHAMYSLAFVLALLIICWHLPRFVAWRWPVLGMGLVFSALVGWSRLYLGVHYPSDVLAGWLAGLAWVLGVYSLLPPARPVSAVLPLDGGPGGNVAAPGTAQ
jgi:membrane-associated phospholipid phosphatase